MQGHVAIVNGLKNIHGFVYPLHYIEHKVYNLLSIAGPMHQFNLTTRTQGGNSYVYSYIERFHVVIPPGGTVCLVFNK